MTNEIKTTALTEERRKIFLRFGLSGIKKLKAFGMIIAIMVAILLTVFARLLFFALYGDTVLGEFVVATSSIAFGIASIVALVASLILIGAPKGFLKANRLMLRAHLVNSASETPFLTERVFLPDEQEQWTFYSRGIPLSTWQDNILLIESALDAAVMSITEGVDNYHTVITLKLHPDPWPTKVIWDNSLLPVPDSVLALGVNRVGPVTHDLSISPHILIAGDTGSGKTLLLQNLLFQLILRGGTVYIADFKGGIDWPDRIWTEKCTFANSKSELEDMLFNILKELDRRKELFRSLGCRNIDVYNMLSDVQIPRIAIACDEVAVLLSKNGLDDKAKKQVVNIERMLSDLAALGRAYGIHLLLATQRPDATIMSGFIRSNMGTKICGRADENLSILVLDKADAHKRIPKHSRGRFVMNDGTEFLGYYTEFHPEGKDYDEH